MMTGHTSRSPWARIGLTVVEMLIVLAILAIMTGAVAPMVARDISHSRVNRAAQALVGNLESALSLAGRQRRPVRITVDPAQRSLIIADRVTGQPIVRHPYGSATDYKVETLTVSPATIDILPHGVATSGATLTVGIGGYSRHVTITRAGHVRLQP